MFTLLVFLICNDTMDFIDENKESVIMGTKIAFSVMIFIVSIVLITKTRIENETMNDRLATEKKAARNAFKKNLSKFETKIVSHVRASPSDFAKTLTNPYHYKNFKFEFTYPEQAGPNEKEKKKTQRNQEE